MHSLRLVQGYRPRIYRGDDCFHAVIRLPAETDPAGDAGGCSGSGRCVREERAGDEGDLDACYRYNGVGDHEGSGPGHGAAGGGGADDGGAVKLHVFT